MQNCTYPDDELEEEQLSLGQFVKISSERLKDTQSIDSFTRLVLSGRLDDELAMELQKRIFINGRQGLQPLTPQLYNISRDYDAAIGICQDIPFLEPFSVFPVSPFSQTLKKDNHICGRAYDAQVSVNHEWENLL